MISSPIQPQTTAATGNGCEPLFEAAHLSIYRENTFRITGLSIDASEREIKKRAAKLTMLEELGKGEDALQHAYSIKPAPTVEQIRAAMQRMKEPEHRLIDEFFWFWPKEFGQSDAAILALQNGDASTAHELWSNEATDAKSGTVAIHNLAVLYHLVALDWTLEDLKTGVDPERKAKIEQYWRSAFRYWEQVATYDEIWDVMKSRVQALDDPRLTTGFVRRMRASLPEAFDKINAEAALQFAETGRMDWARRHIDFMNETHQGLDDVDKTSILVLTPTRKRIKQLVQIAREDTASDPGSGLISSEKLIESCLPLQELFNLFHGESSHHKIELFDEVAETVTNCCVAYGNATRQLAASNNVLRQALLFGSSITLRERIQSNLDIAEGNIRNAVLQPVYDELASIQSSKDSPKDRLNKIKSNVLSFIAQFIEKETGEDDRIPELLDSTAIVLRGISIDAYNKFSDVTVALEAIQLATRLAQSPEQKKQAAQDLELVKEAAGAGRCFFCETRDSHPPSSVSVSMYGLVTRNTLLGTVNYQQTTIKVPRCKDCGKIHGYLDSAAIGLFASGCIAAFFALVTYQGGSVLAAWGISGTLAAVLCKYYAFGSRRNDYPRIKELLAGGSWYLGLQPSR